MSFPAHDQAALPLRAGWRLPAILAGAMLAVLCTTAATSARPASTPPTPAGSSLVAVPFNRLPGWKHDQVAAAWPVWLSSCQTITSKPPEAASGVKPAPELVDICRKALAIGPGGARHARTFFERNFQAWRVDTSHKRAFYTGYYEPEFAGSLTRHGRYQHPVFARPADLVSFDPEAAPDGFKGYAGARRSPDGKLDIYPDRKAIEEGYLAGKGLELAWMADPVDRFFMQVQGSGRLRLPDGSVIRLSYDGKNGHPYTGIGTIVADRTNTPRKAMTMARLRAALSRDEEWGRLAMYENKSFVFFRRNNLDARTGPIGAQGLPITPLRSIAVDRTIWPYGLPVFISTALPDVPGVKPGPVRRLTIAQDTGTAIVGPARADIYFGSGEAAGRSAGAVRHGGTFTVLWPRQTR